CRCIAGSQNTCAIEIDKERLTAESRFTRILSPVMVVILEDRTGDRAAVRDHGLAQRAACAAGEGEIATVDGADGVRACPQGAGGERGAAVDEGAAADRDADVVEGHGPGRCAR